MSTMAGIIQATGPGLGDPEAPGASSSISYLHSLVHQDKLWVMAHSETGMSLSQTFSLEFKATKTVHMHLLLFAALGAVKVTVFRRVTVTPATGTGKFTRTLNDAADPPSVCDFMESYAAGPPVGCQYSLNSTYSGGTEWLPLVFREKELTQLQEFICAAGYHYAIKLECIGAPPATAGVVAYLYRSNKE